MGRRRTKMRKLKAIMRWRRKNTICKRKQILTRIIWPKASFTRKKHYHSNNPKTRGTNGYIVEPKKTQMKEFVEKFLALVKSLEPGALDGAWI